MSLSAEAPKKPEPKQESKQDLPATLARLRAAQRKQGAPDYDARIELLTKLEKGILKRKHDMARAVSKDFGSRSTHETLITDVAVTVNGIRHARAHLHEWMAPQPRETELTALPAKCEVQLQPLGVVGIMSPWNYPIYLALGPLTYVLAAGNRAMIKPSELSPETSALLADFVAETFDEDMVTVVNGGADVGEAFSRLPFDHLVFTGSTRVGKLVMRAAAENLVPVTLELGGKSPAILGDDFPVDVAAERIAWGKLLNAGQTCIAPDYVLVPKGKRDEFVGRFKDAVAKMFPKLVDNKDYTSIVNDRQFQRLSSYLDDARGKGATLVEINPAKEELDEAKRKLFPTLVLDPKDDMIVMQDEIFGPILPVLTYKTIDEAIDFVNDRPRPLALYLFSHDGDTTERVLSQTVSGGVTINDIHWHAAQSDLPFGGVGPSGMGHYHGLDGFLQFSKAKPVFYQSRLNAAGIVRPPYGGSVDFLLKLLFGK
jgi:coniferyl-aldehyde dehydrogenase